MINGASLVPFFILLPFLSFSRPTFGLQWFSFLTFETFVGNSIFSAIFLLSRTPLPSPTVINYAISLWLFKYVNTHFLIPATALMSLHCQPSTSRFDKIPFPPPHTFRHDYLRRYNLAIASLHSCSPWFHGLSAKPSPPHLSLVSKVYSLQTAIPSTRLLLGYKVYSVSLEVAPQSTSLSLGSTVYDFEVTPPTHHPTSL